ncbi:MAG: DMT family transporter [Thermoplasmata archaeon]
MDLAWLYWTLGATVVWGLGTLAAKPGTDRLGPRTMAIGATAVEGIAFGLVGLVLVRSPLPASAFVPALALLAGVAGALGYVFFYEGLRWGSVGLVGTVTAAYPAITVALSVAILHEGLNVFQAFGLALTGGIQSTTGIAGFTLGGGFGYLARPLVEYPRHHVDVPALPIPQGALIIPRPRKRLPG